jgi:5-methylcytosine-specific restriction endonuclease McrA
MRAFVLDKDKKPIMPCHCARARMLLRDDKAKIYLRYPFTIILTYDMDADLQPLEAKIDPGSKVSGVALVLQGTRGPKVICGAHIEHKGHLVSPALTKRRQARKSRRSRKLRYRAARFSNRRRQKGWLAPSLVSRVNNTVTWIKRFMRLAPISSIAVENVKFNMQQMQNPEISGVEYQQGTLFGYETREYLLQKWNRTCVYCDKQHIPLEIDHIIPKSQGGSNRVSNLVLACHDCNIAKGALNIEYFLSHDKTRLAAILKQTKLPLKDAAAVNTTRNALINKLQSLNLPISLGTGGRTKFNRTKQNYPKAHWIDAACVGETGVNVYISKDMKPLIITAMGRGSHQMCLVDKYGFPRTRAKTCKQVYGFRTGDLVKAVVTKGKKCGTYIGRVAIRASGYFNIKMGTTTIQGISFKYCKLLQHGDGYNYSFSLGDGVSSSC